MKTNKFMILMIILIVTFGCNDSSNNEYTIPNIKGKVIKNKKVEQASMEKEGIPWDEGFNAQEWIKERKDNELILNRFNSKEEATKFVEKLYLEGAEKVVVMYELDSNNRKIAENALAVKCPSDKIKAQKIYDLCLTEESRAEVVPLVSANNEFTIHIYWDN